jgi:hypothetical protein
MTTADLAEGVQFTVDHKGQVTAVVVEPALWQRIVEALEDAEDRDLVQALHTRLAQGPTASGALHWHDISDQWR